MKTIKILIVIYCFFCFTSTVGQGQLWGVTQNGGASNEGLVFRCNVDGTGYNIQKEFTSVYSGFVAKYGMTLASNGKLYGVADHGGEADRGVLFEFNPITGVYTKKFDFKDVLLGVYPRGRLVQGLNGKLYGVTEVGGGPLSAGVLFEFDLNANIYSVKFIFDQSNGRYPIAGLKLATNGKLYGTTPSGGLGNQGVLFEYDPATSVFTKKIDFAILPSGQAGSPISEIVQGSNGKLYGTCRYGRDYSSCFWDFI